MTEPAAAESKPAATLRLALVALAALGAIGAAIDLALARHWKSPIQLIPWVTLAVLGVAMVMLIVRPTARRVVVVRAVAVAVTAASLYGGYEHVAANHNAGPLDAAYGAKWDSMSAPAQWWTAATQGVGPSPSVAPGVLAYAALCLGLATLHHPLRVVRTEHQQRESSGRVAPSR